jgi:hypothetical protein
MALDANVRTYDPKQIIVAWGPIIFTGFPEGTYITIARNGDVFEKSKGADGTVDRVNKNANDFMITLTLKQTSITNDLLSAALIADIESNTGKFPFTIKDLNGTSTFFSALAWIAKDPDDEYSDALSNREWRFDTGPAVKVTGGNIE